MNRCYEDILALSKDPPTWYDEAAVPRFCEFVPNRCANLYASEAVLLSIHCQGCGHPFDVCMSWAYTDEILNPRCVPLSSRIRSTGSDLPSIEYGDPPNIGCCEAGPSMTAEPWKVLEFWEKKKPAYEWVRRQDLEIDVKADWMGDDEP